MLRHTPEEPAITAAAKTPDNIKRHHLIKKANQHHCHLSEDVKDKILQLSDNNFGRLEMLVERLLIANLLDKESFNKALQAAVTKVPPVKESIYTKEKTDGFTKVTLDSSVSFFVPQDSSKYKGTRGFNGFVNKAYDNPQSHQPRWAIKRLLRGVNSNNIQKAKKEAKYLTHAGKRSYVYATKKSVKIIYAWQNGQTLKSLVKSGDINTYSFERRLKWVTSLLSELNKSYTGFIIHGDALWANVIVNTDTDMATFVDYGCSQKALHANKWFQTDTVKFGTCIFNDDGIFQAELNSTTIYSSAIKLLSDAMMCPRISQKCTVKQALNYCQLLLQNLKDLDENKLQEIANTTINRKNITVDDVLHGCDRPMRLG